MSISNVPADLDGVILNLTPFKTFVPTAAMKELDEYGHPLIREIETCLAASRLSSLSTLKHNAETAASQENVRFLQIFTMCFFC